LDEHLGILENHLLIRRRVEARVELEFFVLVLGASTAMVVLVELLVLLDSDAQSEAVTHGHCIDAAHLLLVVVHRADSAVDAYLAFHVLDRVVEALAVDRLCLVAQPEPLVLLDQSITLCLRSDKLLPLML